tara:strand:- start:1549 stop:1725 length:177 start_codon:yes stop_codon:yes gene_type:complete
MVIKLYLTVMVVLSKTVHKVVIMITDKVKIAAIKKAISTKKAVMKDMLSIIIINRLTM